MVNEHFVTQWDAGETNRISTAMDNTRTQDAFSQVKAEAVMARVEVLPCASWMRWSVGDWQRLCILLVGNLR